MVSNTTVARPALLTTENAFLGFGVVTENLATIEYGTVHPVIHILRDEARFSYTQVMDLLPDKGDEIRENAESGPLGIHCSIVAGAITDTNLPFTESPPPVSMFPVDEGYLEGIGVALSHTGSLEGKEAAMGILQKLHKEVQAALLQERDPKKVAEIYLSAIDGPISQHPKVARLITDKVNELLECASFADEEALQRHPNKPLVVAVVRKYMADKGVRLGERDAYQMSEKDVMGLWRAGRSAI